MVNYLKYEIKRVLNRYGNYRWENYKGGSKQYRM